MASISDDYTVINIFVKNNPLQINQSNRENSRNSSMIISEEYMTLENSPMISSKQVFLKITR